MTDRVYVYALIVIIKVTFLMWWERRWQRQKKCSGIGVDGGGGKGRGTDGPSTVQCGVAVGGGWQENRR